MKLTKLIYEAGIIGCGGPDFRLMQNTMEQLRRLSSTERSVSRFSKQTAIL